MLAFNKGLSLAILNSNLRKYKNDKDKLFLMNEVFQKQEESGIIERIDNLNEFLNSNKNCSFLPHMPVFKLSRETTKCRMVFLSNLCQKSNNRLSVSHNQAIYSGPCLNQKLSTALINLRFDKYLLIFDLQKAFSQISLSKSDSKKLLFLWFKDIERGNYDIIGYCSVRLPLGLRCSPTLLLLTLYKILILDTDDGLEILKETKKRLYSLIYMDNGSITSNSTSQLEFFYFSLRFLIRMILIYSN